MNRRDLLKWLAAFGIGSGSNLFSGGNLFGSSGSNPIFAGWIDDPKAREKFIANNKYPFLSQLNGNIRGTGKGKTVLLYKYLEQVMGHSLIPHDQAIGDCCGHGFGISVDVLTAVRIAMQLCPEKWIAKSATEIIYGGSRVEIGGGLRGDGSTGSWCADFLRKYGVLLRLKYLDKYDYTNYSGQVARELGARGVPDALEPICKAHPVKTTTLVRSYEECRDAIANGYPVAMCSNVGFNSVRDAEGFLHRIRKPWYHCMAILGVDDGYRRPGCLVQNSWGPGWVTGPTRHEQPAGSFWVDAKIIDTAMKQGDSYALSDYVGYPRHDLPDYNLW